MPASEIDLMSKVCPYVVMHIIRDVHKMKKGESYRFIVDDPLCIKSVPEELEEYEDVSFSISKKSEGWEILISREK